jgi:hypothetical protein
MRKPGGACFLIYSINPHLRMFTGTHISTTLFIPIAIGTPPVFPPETSDFAKEPVRRRGGSLSAKGGRETWRQEDKESRWLSGGRKGRGTRGVCKIHFTLSNYFAHPYRFIMPMPMLGIPVKDVPP